MAAALRCCRLAALATGLATAGAAEGSVFLQAHERRTSAVEAPSNRTAGIASAQVAEGCDVCSASYAGSTVEIVNNCGKPVDVFTDAGNFGSCAWGGGKVPPCLKGLAVGGRATVRLLESATWGYAFHVAPAISTRFEITGWRAGDGELRDSWDISYNAGFDIGMTLKTPAGSPVSLVVATDQEAPGAYQLGADGCQVQPCLSPTYTSNQGRYMLYLCNRPGDVNTPGPCGCEACPGIPCDPNAPGGPPCTTSGGGIFCQVAGDSCPVQCNGLPSNSGGDGCAKECPGTALEPTPAPSPGPTPCAFAVAVRWMYTSPAHPQKCLDVSAGKSDNGNNVQLWDCYADQPNQHFYLPEAGTTGEIQWARHPEKCLSVSGGETSNGNNLHLWECIPGHKDMQFTVPPGGVGLIRWAAHPNKCLDVSAGKLNNGNNIQLWDCYDDQPNMQFSKSEPLSDCP